MSSKMKRFEGHEVREAKIKVTNAGDGLSKAMKVEPAELPIGRIVYVVLECRVGRVSFDPILDSDGEPTKDLSRTQSLRAGTATIVDYDTVKEALEEQRRRNDEADGIAQFPFGDDEGDADPEEGEFDA